MVDGRMQGKRGKKGPDVDLIGILIELLEDILNIIRTQIAEGFILT